MFKGKIKKILFSKSVVTGFLILLQLLFLSFFIFKLARRFALIYIILNFLSMATVLYIAGNNKNPAYKLAWTTLVLLLPVFGGIFYLFFGNKKMKTKKKVVLSGKNQIEDDYLITPQINYLKTFFPVYNITDESGFSYYKTGDECFLDMIEALKKAKDFIFMEYFIIADGVMWDTVFNILKEKASFGVEIRIIYDDCGSLGLLPKHFKKIMKKANIKCLSFNTLRPHLNITMNNRDHRKMMIIDGKTAFSGGINIGDEYINQKKEKKKRKENMHWKDNGIKICGECVNSFTDMFLDMWHLIKKESENLKRFYPYKNISATRCDKKMQIYCENPYDDEETAKNVYLNMITKAKKEILITTPYLILDSELTSALILSSKNGVKIKIVTPFIADKIYVHTLTRSNYLSLINAGIEIFEYTPGFIHSKIFVCDKKVATVGTVNLDYRSLYLHFECGIIMYRLSLIEEIEKDIKETIKRSRKISASDCKTNILVKIIRSILRVFAPLF